MKQTIENTSGKTYVDFLRDHAEVAPISVANGQAFVFDGYIWFAYNDVIVKMTFAELNIQQKQAVKKMSTVWRRT